MIFITLYLKIFINRVESYTFKKTIGIISNKSNFNNNLKN